MLGNYALPPYEFKYIHLLIGALLGVLAAFVLIVLALISKGITKAFSLIPNTLVAGVLGGALVGLITFALPLWQILAAASLVPSFKIQPCMELPFWLPS